MIMERGGRLCSWAYGEDPYDCHRKMGRYRKEERIPEAFGAPFLRRLFLTHRGSPDPAGQENG